MGSGANKRKTKQKSSGTARPAGKKEPSSAPGNWEEEFRPKPSRSSMKYSYILALLAVLLSVCAGFGVMSPRAAAFWGEVSGGVASPEAEEDRVDSSVESDQGLTRSVAANRVLERIAHDEDAFTQGLEYDEARGYLVEGTGLYGHSDLRQVDPSDGSVKKQVSMPDGKTYFGEGICLFHESKMSSSPSKFNRIIQLTWRENAAFVYDAETFDVLSNFTYETVTGEGWGIAYNPEDHEFFVSDGSDTIIVWDADAPYMERRRFQVAMMRQNPSPAQSQAIPVKHLNELEWDASTRTLLANVWYQDVLVRIQPTTGHATHVYDLRHLYPYEQRPKTADCLNGIAKVGRGNDQIYWLTGKQWPYMFRVELGK